MQRLDLKVQCAARKHIPQKKLAEFSTFATYFVKTCIIADTCLIVIGDYLNDKNVTCSLIKIFSVMVGASSLSLVFAYPFAKRYTYWPQFVLG